MSKAKPIKRSPSPVLYENDKEQLVQPLHRFARKTERRKEDLEMTKSAQEGWQKTQIILGPSGDGTKTIKTQAQKNYAAERLDPRWQKKRLEILQRDAFKCTECGDEQSTLHVHHRYYVKGRKCWQYPMFAFTSLCEKCHNATHHPEDDDFQITEWESGIALLTRESNWPDQLWRLAELLDLDFKITLKDLIAFLERRVKEGSR